MSIRDWVGNRKTQEFVMKVLYGVTPNLCEAVGGFVPFYVRCESRGKRVGGTHYQPHSSGVYPNAEDAVDAARQLAIGWSGDVEFVEGCIRCWGEERHLLRSDDGSVSCGCCQRVLRTAEVESAKKAIEDSISRACLAVTGGQCL
jgi:hypothetical protein